jgi:hypothetical protein
VTEAEWLNEQRRSQAMVFSLRGTKVTRTKAGKRKLRLFACACCRLAWDLLTSPLLRETVEVAEQFAESQTSKEELQKAYESVSGLGMGTFTHDAPGHREWVAASMAREVAHPKTLSAAFYMTAYRVPLEGRHGIGEQQRDSILCRLLRCVIGNPFRPSPPFPSVVLAWNDQLVARLAQAAYDERHLPAGTLDTGRLAVLADALEEAGCTDADILGHLRGPGPHVRGCWPVDLCLTGVRKVV